MVYVKNTTYHICLINEILQFCDRSDVHIKHILGIHLRYVVR